MSFGGRTAGIEFSRRVLNWLPEGWPPSWDEREDGAPLFADNELGPVPEVVLSKRAAANISAEATTRRSDEV